VRIQQPYYSLSCADGHFSFIAIMLGRLHMDIDDCVTAFGSLVRAARDRAASSPLSAVDSYLSTLDATVTEILVTYGGSSAEPFVAAMSGACKV
jgi:hypothetical protein